jgi:hypothetical protein
MGQLRDRWFLQEEVEARLIDASRLSSDWIAVEEHRDSYVEHLYAILVPVRRSRARVTFSQVSWSDDLDYTNGRVSRTLIGKRQYLSLRFRRFFNLSFGGNSYLADGKVIVKREKTQCAVGKTEVILARRDFVAKFLKESKQEALWCILSQRYSERSLSEFGLEATKSYERTATSHYLREHARIPQHHIQERPRMASFSQILGKCLLTL